MAKEDCVDGVNLGTRFSPFISYLDRQGKTPPIQENIEATMSIRKTRIWRFLGLCKNLSILEILPISWGSSEAENA